jgi:CxxC motif-containing protein (DUF1111 family)
MTRTYRVWYILALLLALAPPGARLLQWQRTHTEPVDPEMAVAGETLFKRDWKAKDSMCPEGDGLGPVFNATSCVACHNQGGVGGGGEVKHNVTTFTVKLPGQKPREGVIHAGSTGQVETLKDIHPDLAAITRPTLEQLVLTPGQEGHHIRLPAGVTVSQRNTPAVFGSKLIDDIPERVILAHAKAQRMKWGMAPPDDESVPVGRALRLADGRIGRFGWKAQMSNLSTFVQAACANELGLANPGQAQPTPLYLQASLSSRPRGYDLTLQQCDQLTAFCASLPKPVKRLPKGVTEEQAEVGSKVFSKVGCAECHTQNLGSVEGIYSDLLLHPMGRDLVGGGSYGEPPTPPTPDTPDGGPSPSEWRTPPLWGVAQSAPYMHDGRANTLEEAIGMHGGQGLRSASRFKALNYSEQAALVAFLKTLQAP